MKAVDRLAGVALMAALLAGCAGVRERPAVSSNARMVPVEIIAFNDFHGNLEPPKASIAATLPDGTAVKVPAGGAAFFADAVARLKAENPNHIVVSAGDLISASPLASALFLDEPTVTAMNLIGLDLNAVGNHEFDKGTAELKRMQEGGCAKVALSTPCAVEPFEGAKFRFLAANVKTKDGTLFPGTALRSFDGGRVKVGFIGLTLKETAELVSRERVADVTFADEADTINAAIPGLKKAGADAIVVLIHQGGKTNTDYKSCGNMTGGILPILKRLDPAVDVVVSGHTHWSYICDYRQTGSSRPFLLTSAGTQGTLLTRIVLDIDPKAHRVVAKTADNLIVQSDGYMSPAGRVEPVAAFPRYSPEPRVAALVDRYVKAAAAESGRPMGRLAGPATRDESPAGETAAGDLIADAQLAATKGAGAQMAFMNESGVRKGLFPREGGLLTFGDLYGAQPFHNLLVTMTLTGAELRAFLEQQFTRDGPMILEPSANVRFAYDMARPVGHRLGAVTIDGAPLDLAREYRVTVNNFLADGGDGYSVLKQGRDRVTGGGDLDALAAYLSGPEMRVAPVPDRITGTKPAGPPKAPSSG